jgi:hypothetical protein
MPRKKNSALNKIRETDAFGYDFKLAFNGVQGMYQTKIGGFISTMLYALML